MALFFWIIDLLIPVIITGIGLLFTYKPPRRINIFYGYRTARSMASQEAWDTAHSLYGRIMLHAGPPLVAFVVLAKLLIPLPPEELSLVLLSFSFVALIVTIPVVEKRLKMMEEGKQAARRHG
ncbi:MAG: SdpI family protein [Christensenellaceae bacterium]|nr:SdpI family protein [Christensenellaceae bacterium]